MTKQILQIALFSSLAIVPALEANWVTYEGAEISIRNALNGSGPSEPDLLSGSLYYAAEPHVVLDPIGELGGDLVEVSHRLVWHKNGHPFYPRLIPDSSVTASFEPVRGQGYYLVSIEFDDGEPYYSDFNTRVVEVKATPLLWEGELMHGSFYGANTSPTYIENTWMGWLAIFADVDNGWAYAGNLREWFYTRSTNASSVPFYTPSRGWQWTSETAFPYAYQFSTDEWVELPTY